MNQILAQVKLGDELMLGNKTISDVFSTPADLINMVLLPNMFFIAGFILLFLIVGGGISIMTAGQDSKQLNKAKEQVTNAAIGFVVIFTAYWIIQVIEFLTGVPIL